MHTGLINRISIYAPSSGMINPVTVAQFVNFLMFHNSDIFQKAYQHKNIMIWLKFIIANADHHLQWLF
ncbi:hypothetical protein GN956_G6006 [Arapaima gigas]